MFRVERSPRTLILRVVSNVGLCEFATLQDVAQMTVGRLTQPAAKRL